MVPTNPVNPIEPGLLVVSHSIPAQLFAKVFFYILRFNKSQRFFLVFDFLGRAELKRQDKRLDFCPIIRCTDFSNNLYGGIHYTKAFFPVVFRVSFYLSTNNAPSGKTFVNL
jgi:hypothetical protein